MNGRNLIIAALFGLLIAISAWLQERAAPPETAAGSGDIPDFTMDQAVFTIHNLDGKPHARLFAASMVHYNDADLTELVQPVMTLDDQQGPAWTATADRGTLTGDATVVTLIGAVRLDGESRAARKRTRIDTDDLRIDTQQMTAETDAPLKMIQPGLEMTAVGMRGRIDSGATTFHLLNDVEGRYAPIAN